MHIITKAFSPDGARVIAPGEYAALTDAEIAAAKRLNAMGSEEQQPNTERPAPKTDRSAAEQVRNKAERVPVSRERAPARRGK